MKLIYFEIRKIFASRLVIITLALLLAINGVVCVYYLTQNSKGIPQKYINQMFDLYEADPAAFDEEYSLLNGQSRQIQDMYLEQPRQGNYDFSLEPEVNKYAPDGFSDLELMSLVYARKQYAENYASSIDIIIAEAAANLNQYDAQGIAVDDYVYQYQLRLIQMYRDMRDNVEIGFDNARGFDTFFDYRISDYFIFVVLILIGCVIFIQEKSTGIMPILRASEGGRTKTALAKLITMVITIFLIEAAFAIETSAIIGLYEGYSELSDPLQTFSGYLYCPYDITVGEFILIRLLIRILAFALFSAVIMLVSLFLYNYVLVCVSGLGVLGINLLLDAFSNSVVSKMADANIVNVVSVGSLYERYYAVNLLGYVVDFLPCVVIMYAALSIILCVLIVLKYNSLYNTRASKIIPKSRTKASGRLFTVRHRAYTGSLFISEIYKLLVSSKMIVVIAALLITKCTISYYAFQRSDSYGEAIYHDYMTELAGELSEEKEKYLNDKRAEMVSIMSKESDMRRAYMADEISVEEYKSYLNEYNTAFIRSDYLAMVENHARYIKRLASENKNSWFVYDTGWKALLFGSFDWTLYAAILLFSGCFTVEYERKSSSGGFVNILRTTKRGRKRTFRAKYFSVFAVSFVLIIMWNAVDAVLAVCAYDLPLPSAPIYSIEAFEAMPVDITIAEYMVLYYIAKISASLSLAMTVCSLTCLMRRYLSALITVIAATILPAIFSGLGLSMFGYVDYISFFRATPMILHGLVGAGYMFLFAVISVILCMQAERRWKT